MARGEKFLGVIRGRLQFPSLEITKFSTSREVDTTLSAVGDQPGQKLISGKTEDYIRERHHFSIAVQLEELKHVLENYDPPGGLKRWKLTEIERKKVKS